MLPPVANDDYYNIEDELDSIDCWKNNEITDFLNKKGENINLSHRVILINKFLDAHDLKYNFEEDTIKQLMVQYLNFPIEVIKENIEKSYPSDWSKEPKHFYFLIKALKENENPQDISDNVARIIK